MSAYDNWKTTDRDGEDEAAHWEAVLDALGEHMDWCKTPEDAASLLIEVFGEAETVERMLAILDGNATSVTDAIERWYDKRSRSRD